ncbi:hypothetical protein HY605_05190, partial [Candidatus Peregrinibacteria bacterium]|nr:hypothetical protein [Candidatus Peregrinibacteria bacterium]
KDGEFTEDSDRFYRDFDASAKRFKASAHFQEMKDKYPEVFEDYLYENAVDRVATSSMFELGVKIWKHNEIEAEKEFNNPDYKANTWSYGVRFGDDLVEDLLTREIVREAKRLKKITDQQEIYRKYSRKVEWNDREEGVAAAIKEVKGDRRHVRKVVPVLFKGMPGVPEGKGVIMTILRVNDSLRFSIFGGRASYSFDYASLKAMGSDKFMTTVMEWMDGVVKYATDPIYVKGAMPLKGGGYVEMEKYHVDL